MFAEGAVKGEDLDDVFGKFFSEVECSDVQSIVFSPLWQSTGTVSLLSVVELSGPDTDDASS